MSEQKKEDEIFHEKYCLGNILFYFESEHDIQEVRAPLYKHQDLLERIIRVLQEEKNFKMKRCINIKIEFPDL